MPTPASDHQPRLSRWGHAWRLILMLALSALVWVPVAGVEHSRGTALTVLDVVLGLGCYVLVFFRRRWPVAVAVLTAVAGTLSGTAGGPAVLAAVSMATRRRWREIVPVALLNLVTSMAFSLMNPSSRDEPFWLSLSANVIATGAMMAWGLYIGSRRELLWTLRQRAERAESEQEQRAGLARTTERARIAREMHDVLAHRISQIAMHAGALGFRDDLTAEQLRDGAQQIQLTAHEALTDLRGVLGVLREGGAAGDPATAPPADLRRPARAREPGAGQRSQRRARRRPGVPRRCPTRSVARSTGSCRRG